jgi:hypothetical protein
MVAMRRVFVFAVVLVLGALLAAPAFGQTRDPFEPQEGGSQQQEDTGGDTASQDDPFEPSGEDGTTEPDPTAEPTAAPTTAPDPAEDPPTEVGSGSTLSNTGADVSTWSGIAYVLLAFGATALLAGKMFAPAIHRRRR